MKPAPGRCGELKGRGISLIASAGQSTDHILSFFSMLRLELGFYVACLNLRDRLAKKGEPICFPVPLAAGKAILSGRGLYDLCLSLGMKERVVGNDLSADHKLLVMITGANRGGKSTFLRAIGLAQLMMQCGMFAPAESFRANLCDGIFTHYKREEDAGMRSGKLDEELSRMSAIMDNLTPNSIVLLNESFAATNEREGSEIARQIVRALLERASRSSTSPTSSIWRKDFTAQRWTPPCSFARKGWPTGGGRFDWSKANRCRRAMAKTCIGGFSAR